MKTYASAWVASVVASSGVACGAPSEADLEACLGALMQQLEEPARGDEESGPLRVSCAQPYGTKACAAAWWAVRAARTTDSQAARDVKAATDEAIQACVPRLCANLTAPRPRLCEAPPAGGFLDYVAWQELHRAVLERDLGHSRALAILGFLAGMMRPTP